MNKIALKFGFKNASIHKAFIIGLVVIVTLVLSSCNLESSTNYTPRISLLQPPVLQNGDSLQIKYTAIADEYLMDTIRVGDSVLFVLHFNAYSNNITQFLITQSADSVSRIKLPSREALDSTFLPTSDYKTGRFVCKPKISLLGISFWFVAKNSTNNSKLSFFLESDAKFDFNYMGSNVHSFKIITPIKSQAIAY